MLGTDQYLLGGGNDIVLQAGEYAVAVTAITAFLAGVFKFVVAPIMAKPLVKALKPELVELVDTQTRDLKVNQVAVREQVSELQDTTDTILRELRPNGGSSLRDRVNAHDAKLTELAIQKKEREK